MRKRRYTEKQIVGILKESEAGLATGELCRKHGISYHGKFREECQNEHWFLTLADARQTIESWRLDYNRVRPHSSLGYLTPEEFATGRCGLNFAAKLNPECSHLPGLNQGAAHYKHLEDLETSRFVRLLSFGVSGCPQRFVKFG
jgi:hypothetical protein